MKFYAIWLLFFFVMSANAGIACNVTDDTGQVLQLQQPAKRIISLAPDLTEILFAMGAGDKIVGVMHGSDYPPQAKHIKNVANYNSVDLESILALHPDLIVSWTDIGFSTQLKKLHVPIFFSHQKKITDIPDTMRRLGCLTGNEKQAENAADVFLQKYRELKRRYAKKKIITVFYQVWSKPLITITRQSWINEIISLCRGRNIFADLSGTAPSVDLEAVVLGNPDVIIGSDLLDWQHWQQVSAVNHHFIYRINTDLIERAGPRLLEGAENLCKVLDNARPSSPQAASSSPRKRGPSDRSLLSRG